jgi:hypothetical protein
MSGSTDGAGHRGSVSPRIGIEEMRPTRSMERGIGAPSSARLRPRRCPTRVGCAKDAKIALANATLDVVMAIRSTEWAVLCRRDLWSDTRVGCPFRKEGLASRLALVHAMNQFLRASMNLIRQGEKNPPLNAPEVRQQFHLPSLRAALNMANAPCQSISWAATEIVFRSTR